MSTLKQFGGNMNYDHYGRRNNDCAECAGIRDRMGRVHPYGYDLQGYLPPHPKTIIAEVHHRGSWDKQHAGKKV